jgi:hypothetical protein
LNSAGAEATEESQVMSNFMPRPVITVVPSFWPGSLGGAMTVIPDVLSATT